MKPHYPVRNFRALGNFWTALWLRSRISTAKRGTGVTGATFTFLILFRIFSVKIFQLFSSFDIWKIKRGVTGSMVFFLRGHLGKMKFWRGHLQNLRGHRKNKHKAQKTKKLWGALRGTIWWLPSKWCPLKKKHDWKGGNWSDIRWSVNKKTENPKDHPSSLRKQKKNTF